MAKKEEKQTAIENSEVLAEKLGGAERWIEDNPKVVFGVLAVIVLAAAGFFGYRWWIDKQDQVAQVRHDAGGQPRPLLCRSDLVKAGQISAGCLLPDRLHGKRPAGTGSRL
jgi:hypothetical protein